MSNYSYPSETGGLQLVLKFLPSEGAVNFAALKAPKQHIAYTITWSDFRLEAPSDQTDCKCFRMTGVIGKCGFAWLLSCSAHVFFTPSR